MRLKTLDIAKGIAIILVVIGHFLPDGSPHWYVVLRQIIYSFHMPLFLFISGFVYIYSWKGLPYGTFLLSKVRRIAIPYFVVSLLFILIKFVPQLLGIYLKNPVTLSSFVRMFYYPEAAVSLWYLWALWWFYMLTPLFRTRSARVAVLVVALIVSYLPFRTTEVFSLDKVKEMYCYFMMGAVVADYRGKLLWVNRLHIFFPILLFAGAVLLWQCLGVQIGLLLAVSGSAVCLQLAHLLVPVMEKGRLRWLETVSASSYMIYLLHPVFVAGALAVIYQTRVPLPSAPVFVSAALLTCFLGVAGPVAVRKTLSRLSLRHTPSGSLRTGVRKDHNAE